MAVLAVKNLSSRSAMGWNYRDEARSGGKGECTKLSNWQRLRTILEKEP
jgi:hypothetical protein